MGKEGVMTAQAAKNGVRTVPEAGQWPDKVAPVALIAGAVLTVVGLLLAFFYAGPVNGASVDGVELIGGQMVSNKLLISQKIFYFHMPVAITSFAALVFAAYYSIRFLVSKQQRFDTCARIAMEVALVFVLCTMATGEMWTRFEWGTWWAWEPRLTTYLVLMLIIIAYFVLRASVDDPEKRGVFSAVVSLFAFVDVPICFAVTRLIPSSLHPVVLREGGMSGDMALALVVCLIGMLCLGFALYRLRFRQVRLTERVEALKKQMD